MSSKGFDIVDIFGEGKTPSPVKKGKKGKRSKKDNGFEINMPKIKGMDSITKMQKDSVIQSKTMGIDQPNESLKISVFNENVKKAPNPLNFGLKIEAGFDKTKKNPLNVGLKSGNLGIDTLNINEPAFSGREIDQGFGATPKPRSALAGASNLGADFITRARGSERTGLQGGGEQDFLKVSGKSFAGVPQILPSGVDQSPTVQGAKNRAKAESLKKQGTSQSPQINVAQGLEGLAGGIGKAGTAVTLAEKKQRKARQRITKSGIVQTLKKRAERDSADVNPFRLRERKKVRESLAKGKAEAKRQTDQEEQEEFVEKLKQKREEQIRKELRKRGIDQRTVVSNDPELEDLSDRPIEQEDKTPMALPFNDDFDKDGDGDIDSITNDNDNSLKGVFGTVQPKSKDKTGSFIESDSERENKEKKLKRSQ